MHPETKSQVKKQIKELALLLRDSKKDLRDHMSQKTYDVTEQWAILARKKEFRHLHVAYCVARGRTVETVESKVSKDNPLNKDLVAEYAATFAAMDAENNIKFPRPPKVIKEAE